ncbi:Protocadherin gamma-A10, partial [Schistosoma japonicum]
NNNNNNNNVMPLHLISSHNSLIPVHLWISEYLMPRSLVAILKVNDIDQGVNGTVQCTLNNSYFLLQSETIHTTTTTINDNDNNDKDTNHTKSYYIVSIDVLDYELQTMHHLSIVCNDLGEPISKTSTILLNIHIHDENDNEPKFLQPEISSSITWLNRQQFQSNSNVNNLYDFHRMLLKHQLLPLDITIPETCSINTTIMKFPVHDIDSGINSLVHYELHLINQYVLPEYNINDTYDVLHEHTNNHFIKINNTTGEITICKSLKLIPEYIKFIYEIHVNDCGIPKHTIRLYITIQITLVNLSPPDIQLFYVNAFNTTLYEVYKSSIDKKYEIQIYENQPIGTIIGKIIGLDTDRGEAGRVTFTLKQNLIKTCIGSYKQVDDIILIDSNNGIITTLKSIDREIDGNLMLITLLVQDHGIPFYTTTVNIDIKILDINDNPPMFLLPLRPCRQSDIMNNQSNNLNDKLTCNTINLYSSLNTSNQLFNLTMLLPRKSNKDFLYPFAQFKAIDYDIGINALVTYHLHENCNQSNTLNKHTLNHLFVIDEYSGCLSMIIRQFHNEHVQSSYTFCIIASDHGEFIQHQSIIEANVYIQSNINQSIIFMNYSIKSTEQLIKTKMSIDYDNERRQQLQQQQQQQQLEQQQQQQQTLTPVIRALLCITTTIGGLMIIIVGILSIKQPSWLLRNLCKKNSNEAAKAELLRFHEVHNQIEVKRNFKHKSNEMKSYDIELERNQNYPLLLCSNTDTLTTDVIVTQTHQQPVQIHLPQDYCIEQTIYPNHSNALLTYCSHSQCQHSQHQSNHNLDSTDPPPVFFHIVRTCDILDDSKLIKPIIETTTTGHIVESKEIKCIYCNEKSLDNNWNQNIV